MILRNRPKPVTLEKYERLIPRLSPHVPGVRKIHAEADRRLKGYVGEKKTDNHTNLLASQFSILYDIGLKIQGKTVQFDTLIITPHAIFPIESKNFSGVITFDAILKQLIRDNGKAEKGYRYPITQAELQKMKLQLWLQQHNLAHIPIYPLVAISDPATVVKVIGDQESIAKMVFHAEYIPKQIMDMEAQLKGDELNHYKIARMILRECVELDRDIIAEHEISVTDLKPGVQCPACKYIGLKRMYGAWWCERCRKKHRNAHKQALEDYILLVRSYITNEENRKWLNINSRHLSKTLLQKSKLVYNSYKKRWESR
ncbi:nuclease-related domain-containing protein [Virgibacillus oceani]